MLIRLIGVFSVLVFNSVAIGISDIRILEREWTSDAHILNPIIQIFPEGNIFPYAVCNKDGCKAVLEVFRQDNLSYRYECETKFENKSAQAGPRIWASSPREIVFSFFKKNDRTGDDHIIRFIDVHTCESKDVKIASLSMYHENMDYMKFLFNVDTDTYEMTYWNKLCENKICKLRFNKNGQILANMQPFFPKSSTGFKRPDDMTSVIFIPFGKKSEHFGVVKQTHVTDNSSTRFFFLKENAGHSEVIEIIDQENESPDFFDNTYDRAVEIESSDPDFLTLCVKDMKKKNQVRCLQYDSNFNKKMDVQVHLSHDATGIRILSLEQGRIALATHEIDRREDRFYLTRIESNGNYGPPLVVDQVHKPNDFRIALSDLFKDEANDLCLMILKLEKHYRQEEHKFGVRRICLPTSYIDF